MVTYFDTSALAKNYTTEPGSSEVRRLLAESNGIFTSRLTDLELVSFAERAKRERRIDSPVYRQIFATLQKDVQEGFLILMNVTPDILQVAKRILRQRRLHVQDSIQLATALELQQHHQGEIRFVCSDQALLDAARLEGLRCVDPGR